MNLLLIYVFYNIYLLNYYICKVYFMIYYIIFIASVEKCNFLLLYISIFYNCISIFFYKISKI